MFKYNLATSRNLCLCFRIYMYRNKVFQDAVQIYAFLLNYDLISFKTFSDIYKDMVSMATPYMSLKNGDRPTKSIVSMVLLILEH